MEVMHCCLMIDCTKFARLDIILNNHTMQLCAIFIHSKQPRSIHSLLGSKADIKVHNHCRF